MAYLLAASVIWALSFGLIQHVLVAPGLPPSVVAFWRLFLSFLLFVPLLRPGPAVRPVALRLGLVGAVQYGFMYLAYTESFRFLPSHVVALCTVLTPLYVAVLHDAWSGRFHRVWLLAAGLAAAGAAVALGPAAHALPGLKGFLLVQGANLAFAAGQVAYRRWMPPGTDAAADRQVFALLYLGGALVALVPAAGWLAQAPAVTWPQAGTLLYLGLIPSGVGFYLWNRGARTASPGVVAVMNNAKAPLAVLSSVALFGEKASLSALLVGGVALLCAAWLAARADTRSGA